jgi:cysteine desulfurase
MIVYLDHNATTPLDERVLEVMLPYLREQYGNPSSGHQTGRAARAGIDRAREQVSALVGAHPSQVIFTSGGTEANNLALKGVTGCLSPGLIALSAVEHDSVSIPARTLRRQGWETAEIPVDGVGCIDEAGLSAVLARKPKMLAVMQANNETGIVYNTAPIAAAARESGAILLTDAVQAAGKIVVDFGAGGAHLMSLSAHKIYGPKGVGALIVDKALDLEPLLHGGGHEKGRRAGTENVAAIVGFGQAAELARSELVMRRDHLQPLRSYLENRLQTEMPQMVIFGAQAERLPNTTFFAVPGLDGETLLMALDQAGLAVSSGSACGSGEVGSSHVLLAMKIGRDLARGAIRVSLGRGTRHSDIDRFVDCFKQQLQVLRNFGAMAYA